MKLFVFFVFLLLSSIFTDAFNQIKYPGCGKGVPKEMIDEFEKLEEFDGQNGSSSRTNGMSSRAINMKPVKSRPAFFVILEIITDYYREPVIATGTLITKNHVLTADRENHLDPVISMTVIKNNYWGETRTKAKSYQISKRYVTGGFIYLCLVALPKEHSLKDVIPICLPMAKVEIKGIRGQVASTGQKYFNVFSENICVTNEVGFSKFKKCATGCMRMEPVGQKENNCKEKMVVARNKMKATYHADKSPVEDMFDVLEINQGDDKKVTCYSENILRENPTLCLDTNRDWGFCSPACQYANDPENRGMAFSNQVIDEEWFDEETSASGGCCLEMFNTTVTTLSPLTISVKGNWDIDVIKRKKVTPPPGYMIFQYNDIGSPFWTYKKDLLGNYVAQLIGIATDLSMDDKSLNYINIATESVLEWLRGLVNLGDNLGTPIE